MLARLIFRTRYMILVPVIGTWIAALLALGFGVYEVILTIIAFPTFSEKTVKQLSLNLIEGVDLFLLSTAFYLIALGLFDLFIDEKTPTPSWLAIHNLDDLKDLLLKVIVVVLGVQFLAQVLGWKGGIDILYLGGAIAAIILAVAVFTTHAEKPTQANPE